MINKIQLARCKKSKNQFISYSFIKFRENIDSRRSEKSLLVNIKHSIARDENIVFDEAFLSKNNDQISINRIEIDKKSVTAKQMVHDI